MRDYLTCLRDWTPNTVFLLYDHRMADRVILVPRFMSQFGVRLICFALYFAVCQNQILFRALPSNC